MIGVAFALRNTFGTADGIEETALARVLEEFVRIRRLEFESSKGGRVASVDHLDLPSRIDLASVFTTALQPHLVGAADAVALEARFRARAALVARERFVAYDDVFPTLQELHRLGVPCAGLSGGWASVDQRKAHVAGFDSPIVFAEDFDIDPASPTAFAYVAQTLRMPADRIWFVGTEPLTEILPAAAVGMRTIWIDRTGVPFPARRTAPDATVPSFGGILDVLGEPYTRGLLALRHIMRTALHWRPGHFIGANDAFDEDAGSHG